MHDLFKPFNRGGAVDVRAFVKSVMTTDGPHDSYVPNGLFTEQPPEKEPLSGRRHVDPKQQRAKSTESFLVSSKRVHGYNKAKGIPPKPYPRRHHRQSESGSHLKATKTTVQFTLSPEKIAATLARSGSTAPRQSLADLPTPDRREFHFRPPTAAVTTVNFVTPAEEKLAPAKVEASSSSSNVLQRRPKSSGRKHLVSPFSPIKRPDSPKATAFQRLPIPPRPTTPLATDASRAATLGGDENALDDADVGSDSSADDMGGDDANVVEGGLAALTVTDEPTPTTPRRRPTTAQQPSFEAFEPLAPPRISLVHQRQQTTTTYKSMKPNFRISESTFCCR
ncbi:hypothetical protein SPRG_06082 [Saprolegnia parasitica CBS 223.65]|uniref:Uncharacterized protein n=1 Tax=Saprolegnia parasitica (strain CBS 223.65) TaxID=695850 RepID=A0A067CQC4_SAPPC|nr:hypothetical protein SPRG_06082 [Saprolegnia parasitica CBS 223.65]KDO29027.1 hypothetical protein SPRG_06082 [Saprolegnia parasitica CBS 223.65]|eukprot:XP_012200197.1 hypothetical protein SPRG_06082 [Saprolegnia parasitica CBS 223.65]